MLEKEAETNTQLDTEVPRHPGNASNNSLSLTPVRACVRKEFKD